MEQKQSNLVTFWKRLFGTAEKKKQEGLDKQTSFSTWQKLREKTDPNYVFPESGFVVIFLTDNGKRRSGAINKQEEASSKRSFLLLRVQKAQKFKKVNKFT